MKIEINEEEIECLESSIKSAIKSSSILQLMAIISPNELINLDEIMESNAILAKSFEFIKKIKKEAQK